MGTSPSEKYETGQTEIDSCPVCEAKPSILYSIERFSPSFDILICPDCGLQMQATLPLDPDQYYNEDYYTGRAEYSYKDERDRIPFERYVWRARLKNIARFIAPPANFLDIGCAFGGFVAEANRFGYEAKGLDVSPFVVQYGREAGLDLRTGRLEPGIFPTNSFNVVTMIEVFEHLSQPREACAALADLLRPGGLCVIQTANFDGLQAQRAGENYHYYLPGHLFYYSARNLKELLQQFGFSRFELFRPVDFGLTPKLLKSRGNFQTWTDYFRWAQIAYYHIQGLIAHKDFAMTSSMVLYAFRDP